jgi:hypothetical protein
MLALLGEARFKKRALAQTLKGAFASARGMNEGLFEPIRKHLRLER